MNKVLHILFFLIATISVAQNDDAFDKANVLYNEGKFQEAIDTMREGRTFGLEAGEKNQTPKVINSLGWVFHELCLYDQAISCNNEALDYVKEIVGRIVANSGSFF